MTTKKILAAFLLVVGLSSASQLLRAGAATPVTPSASAVAATDASLLDQKTLDKRTAPILKALALTDTTKEARVRAILEPHFQTLQVWHGKNDASLAALWTKWSAARAPEQQDEVKAAAIVQQIVDAYASLQPQHEAFLGALAKELTPTQVDAVKDSLTKSPGLQRTYEAYLQIFPELTAPQKEFVLQKLLVARERALDAITDKEKANIFKTQKIQVEAYFNTQGYDWKKSYAAYVAKLNAQTEAAKSAKKN